MAPFRSRTFSELEQKIRSSQEIRVCFLVSIVSKRTVAYSFVSKSSALESNTHQKRTICNKPAADL
jgi:hypothetical protein